MNQRKIKIILILLTTLWILCFFPSLGAAMITPVLFNIPGATTKSLYTYIELISILSFPFVTLLSVIYSWKFYQNNEYTSSLLWSILPLSSIILFSIGLLMR